MSQAARELALSPPVVSKRIKRLEERRGTRLLVHNADHWRLDGPEGVVSVPVPSFINTHSSEVIRAAVLSGLGIALRSTRDIGPELRSSKLAIVLPRYRASHRVAIHAVYPSRRDLPQRKRVFIGFLVELYGAVPAWDQGLALP